MAGGGYRGILAGCPLRNTCVRPLGKGQQIKIKSQSNGNGNGDQQLREQVESSHRRSHIKQIGVQLLLLTTHQAER
jgi:hypothetical protein